MSDPTAQPKVWVSTTACMAYVKRYGGNNWEAAEAIRAMLPDLLTKGAVSQLEDGFWQVNHYDVSVILSEEQTTVVGFRQFHRGSDRRTMGGGLTSAARSENRRAWLEPALAALPMAVSHEALYGFSRKRHGEKVTRATAKIVFAELAQELEQHIMPEWNPEVHRKRWVEHDGLRWRIHHDPDAPGQGRVVNIVDAQQEHHADEK